MHQVSSRGMTLRYVVALGLVALLTITSHIVLTETLRANEGSAAVINRSGRQRMLSQRINGLAAELHAGDEEAREPLRTAIRQFANSHAELVGLAKAPPQGSIGESRLYDVYFGPAEIDHTTARFLAAARRVSERSRDDPADLADVKLLSDLSKGPLLSGLEEVVSIHQSVSEARSARMEQIQWSILLIVLMTLAFEAVFIFRPMVQSITGYVGQLLRVADHDYLTGVLNRGAFTTRAEAEIQRSRRYGRMVSLMLFDVDHFKQVNDQYGHLAGDLVLSSLSRMIEGQARREDLIGRIGGEEFAILLPEAGLAGAIEAAERIRTSVAATPIEAGDSRLDVTVSIGVAEVDLSNPRPLLAALADADIMLYKAKEAGRNCVRPHAPAVRKMQVVA